MDGRPSVADNCHCFHKCLSWSAIFAGGLVGVGLSFLLNLFSGAIGLAAFSTNTEGASAFAIGGFLGFLIGAIVSMFVTGFVAGYLAKPYCGRRHLGVMYGFFAWALTLIIAVILSSHFAAFVSANSDVLNNRAVVVSGNEQGPAVSQTNSNTTVVNAQSAASDLAHVAFVAFVLFFLGALASCFGGHVGMSCRREECYTDRPRV